MQLMDTFSKLDTALDSSCRRNERLFFDLSKELGRKQGLTFEMEIPGKREPQDVEVEKYIKDFRWDQVKFQMDKSLKVLGTKIQTTQKIADDKLKKLMDDTNEIKSKLSELVKKDSPSFLAKDLGDLVYERKIKKDLFVNTYEGINMLVTVLVVVPKKSIDKFTSSYVGWLTEFY